MGTTGATTGSDDTEAFARDHGLLGEEYDKLVDELDRLPTMAHLGVSITEIKDMIGWAAPMAYKHGSKQDYTEVLETGHKLISFIENTQPRPTACDGDNFIG